jgi:hypothetical protein
MRSATKGGCAHAQPEMAGGWTRGARLGVPVSCALVDGVAAAFRRRWAVGSRFGCVARFRGRVASLGHAAQASRLKMDACRPRQNCRSALLVPSGDSTGSHPSVRQCHLRNRTNGSRHRRCFGQCSLRERAGRSAERQFGTGRPVGTRIKPGPHRFAGSGALRRHRRSGGLRRRRREVGDDGWQCVRHAWGDDAPSRLDLRRATTLGTRARRGAYRCGTA